VAIFPLSPDNSTLWLPSIIFSRWQYFAYIVRPVRRALNNSIPPVPQWQHPIAFAYNVPPVAALCLYRTPRTTCPQWQHSPCPPVAAPYGFHLWRSPGDSTMASALRGSPGGSTPPVAYAPYDVPQWQHSLCFRPRRSPVVTRLWLPPYNVPPVVALPCGLRPSGSTPSASAYSVPPVVAQWLPPCEVPPVTAPAPITYAPITVPCGVPPINIMASALRNSSGGSIYPVIILPRWLQPRTAFF